jgi:hypothetical protein
VQTLERLPLRSLVVLVGLDLADGRLVFGFPDSGLLVWEPGAPQGHQVTQRGGLALFRALP